MFPFLRTIFPSVTKSELETGNNASRTYLPSGHTNTIEIPLAQKLHFTLEMRALRAAKNQNQSATATITKKKRLQLQQQQELLVQQQKQTHQKLHFQSEERHTFEKTSSGCTIEIW